MFEFLKGDSAPQHPGELSTLQRGWEMVKHVASKALKWGAYGAIAGGALMAFVPGVVGGGLSSVLSLVGIHANLMGPASYAMTQGALYLGSAAAVAGGMIGLTGAGDAADTANEQSIFNYNRARAQAAQQQMLQQRYQQAQFTMGQQGQAAGISPNIGFGLGGGQQLS